MTLVALPINTSAKTIKQFEDEVAKYTKELQAKKDNLAKNDAEIAQIRSKISSIEKQIATAEEEINSLQDEIEKSNEEIKVKGEESKRIISAPFPDMVLSISRRTAPVARYIKKLSPQTKLIQLMHPGNAGLNEFDLVIVPEHDKGKKQTENVHYIVGCPHRVNEQYLKQAHDKWEYKFAHLPRPFTAVIVGGAIKKKPFTAENALALGKAIRELKQKIGGSILITTSRRTGQEAQDIIMTQAH